MSKDNNAIWFFIGAHYGVPFLILVFGIAGFLFLIGLIFLILVHLPK